MLCRNISRALDAIDRVSIRVRPLEAVHGTPIVDIKPVL